MSSPTVSDAARGRSQPKGVPRHSARHQAGEDGALATHEDMMAKAMRHKATLFSTPPAGTPRPSKSFLSFLCLLYLLGCQRLEFVWVK